MANVDKTKSLSSLLNGIAQIVYYSNKDITEELLKNELYPDLSHEEFKLLHDKMKALIKVMRHFWTRRNINDVQYACNLY